MSNDITTDIKIQINTFEIDLLCFLRHDIFYKF